MSEFSCSRCGSVSSGLEAAPLPGEAGTLVLEQTCPACWGEWIKAQVILMNENRWTPANPEHFSALLGHMKTYLQWAETAEEQEKPELAEILRQVAKQSGKQEELLYRALKAAD